MSILVPNTEPNVYQDAETIQTYNQEIGAYQDCESALAHDGEVWREVWPEHKQEMHYLMLYDRGDECTDVTGGWEYVQNAGIHNAAYIGDGIWRTKKRIDFTAYPKGIAYRVTRFISGSSPRNYTWLFSGSSYREPLDQNTYQGPVVFDTGSPESLAPSIHVYSNTYYETNNRGERRERCLYIYHRYAGYSEGEEYVYSLFVYQEDDWQTWLAKAGLDKGPYGTVEAVMADADALGVLLSSRRAVAYMIYQCTGSVMASAIQSAAFRAALESSPYRGEIYANEHWEKFLTMAAE